MSTKIFLNLPVKELDRSVAFFSKLGFSFNPQFTDEKATCMVISEDIYVMLLVETFFKTFTPKQVADTSKTTEAITALALDSRQEVDNLYHKAVTAGAGRPVKPQDDSGMYGGSFEDPDGHLWEIFFMENEP